MKKMILSTWISSLLTLFSRILGLARDKALVMVFGATGGVLDAFLLAFTIPNLFRRLFGEGALSSAFLPVFVDYRENRDPKEANRFAGAVLTALLLFLSGLVLVGIFLCLGGAQLFAEGSKHILTLRLTAAMLPFLIFICLAALGSGMLQSLRCFALPAAMPILLNLGFLGVLGWITWYSPVKAPREVIFYVAAAVVAAGVAQLLILYLSLFFKGVRLWPVFSFRHEGLQKVLLALGPAVVGLAVFQINVLVDRLIAYLLCGEGAMTYLYLGNRLMQLPLGLFGVAMATVAFPELISHMSRKEWSPLFNKLSTSIRFLIFIMLPATAGLIALADPTIRMIFFEPDTNSFGEFQVYRTSVVMACYAPGLFFIALQQLLTRVFYAKGDYRTPVRITAVMVGLNLVLNLILIHAPDLYRQWAYGESLRLNEGGLALSTSICAMLTAIWMWSVLRRELRVKDALSAWDKAFAPVTATAARIIIAAIATGVFAHWVAGSIPVEPEVLVRVERGIIGLLGGFFGYFIFCYVFDYPEIPEFLWRSKPEKGAE
ncbi:MAG: murein biosynthesis integral membrane protein MurJ [Planctomycetes bacterium]|nr:murein biosynthesis integral membrane protein MurJ [Planctomycetota bacterium]